MRFFTVPKSLKDEFVGKPVEVFQQGFYKSQNKRYLFPRIRAKSNCPNILAVKNIALASKDFNEVRILFGDPESMGTFDYKFGRLNVSVSETSRGGGSYHISALTVG